MLDAIRDKVKGRFKRDASARPGKKKKKKIVRNSIIAAVILAIGLGSYIGYTKWFGGSTAEAITAQVTRGNISKTIEGSGTIAAINQYEVTSLVKGEILADHFEEGQEITKGDLMYEIDTTDMDNTIQKAQADLEKSQLSYEQSAKTLENLTVAAPVTGVITELYVENGDSVQSGTKIADMINSDQMRLTIDFNAGDAQSISVGQWADVSLENSFTTLSGTVTSVATGALTNSDGVSVTPVEILVDNPGGINSGDRATATVGGYACNAPGTFAYSEEVSVTAKAAGDVTGLSYRKGDRVSKNAVLLRLDSDTTANTVRQSELSLEQSRLSLQNSYDQLENYNITAPISGKVIQKTSKAGDKLDNTNSSTVMAIIADLSTLVFEISVDELDISGIEEGQTVTITADAVEGKTFTGYVDNVSIVGTSSNGVTSYPVKVVIDQADGEGLIPGMNVSAEIVIESRENVLCVPVSAVKRGNIVTVKSSDMKDEDRIENAQQQGSARSGAVQSGPGEQQSAAQSPGETEGAGGRSWSNALDNSAESGGLRDTAQQAQEGTPPEGGQPGEPSADVAAGDAPAETAEGTAPETDSAASALPQMEGALPGSAALSNEDIPSGYENVRVITGLSDGNYIEIISGLSEGATILLPDITTSSTASTAQEGMMGMGGGMPGGGMPGGGMPGGGMPGGAPGGGASGGARTTGARPGGR